MELSSEKKDYIVVTRLGDFWVNKEKAKSVRSGLGDKDGKVDFEDFGTISMGQVFGVLNREGYQEYQNKQNGKWKCEKETWHDKFTKCDCSREIYKTYDKLNISNDHNTEVGEGYKKFQKMKKKLLK